MPSPSWWPWGLKQLHSPSLSPGDTTRGHGPDSEATCAGPASDPPPPALPAAFPDSGPTGCSESLVFLGSPHRLFLPAPTLWRVCSAHSPPRPTHCRPCQDGTCPCTDMPLGTKLWTSQEGPAHVPPLLAVTLPQTTHPCPHDCPRHSCQRNGPGATLPSVRGDSLLASPHYPLPPVAREPEPFAPRPSPPCVEDGLYPTGPGDRLAVVCSWSQPWFCFLLKNGNLGHRQLKGDPGPQSEILPACLPARALLGIPNLTAHSRTPEVTQAHFLWEAGGAVEQGLLLGGDWAGNLELWPGSGAPLEAARGSWETVGSSSCMRAHPPAGT